MDVARLNFSHGDYSDHKASYDRVRAASDATGRAVGILADLQGPKIRLGRFADGPTYWADGESVRITIADCAAYVSLPLVAMTTKVMYGEDALQAAGIDWKSYIKRVEERPSAQKVTADRKAAQAAQLQVLQAREFDAYQRLLSGVKQALRVEHS